VKKGYYPDLTKRNSYCSCGNQGQRATYTRCKTFPNPGKDYKYDAWDETIKGQSYIWGVDTGGITNPTFNNIPLGCGGYGGTKKEGTCGPKDEVSPQGRNTRSYEDLANHKITCPFNGGRRLHASPSATPRRQLTAPEKKESAAAATAAAVVAAAPPKNSASFVTTIKLSTTVHKESAAGTTTALPDRRGTVRTLTVSVLLVVVAHFWCL